MKLLVSKTGRVYAAGPRRIRKINQADIIRRLIKECQEWTVCFST